MPRACALAKAYVAALDEHMAAARQVYVTHMRRTMGDEAYEETCEDLRTLCSQRAAPGLGGLRAKTVLGLARVVANAVPRGKRGPKRGRRG